MARMKVFCWSDGLHAYTLATTSRAKALDAWGFKRDLFKDGEAKELVSGDDYDCAITTPGVTIQRGLSADVGKVVAMPAAKAHPKPARPSAADLRRAERLQAELEALGADRSKTLDAIERQVASLQNKAKAARDRFDDRRRALDARLDEARRKLER